jgi:GTPase SAR1 family protein
VGKIPDSSVRSFIYKVVVVGDGGVGKTSMVLRYCENSFKENYIMTIGSNFSTNQIISLSSKSGISQVKSISASFGHPFIEERQLLYTSLTLREGARFKIC